MILLNQDDLESTYEEEFFMRAAKILTAFLAIIVMVFVVGCQNECDDSEKTKAPYMTDLAAAKAMAVENGRDILVNFHSDT